MVSEDARSAWVGRAFPADFPHLAHCHCSRLWERVVEDSRVFQHIAGCAPHRHRCGGQLPLACLGDSYLRTVIVTAAVYRRLGSGLRSEELTPPLNVPAPGRRQSVYVVLRLSTDLCF
jgi:hypothetical protein